MSVLVSRVYKDAASALDAIGHLEAAGLHHESTVVTINGDTRVEDPVSAFNNGPDRAPNGQAGALARVLEILVVIGLLILALICIALLAIPGLGAIVAGLIVGGLIQHAMSSNASDDPKIRRGGTLVAVRVSEAERTRYQNVLDRAA